MAQDASTAPRPLSSVRQERDARRRRRSRRVVTVALVGLLVAGVGTVVVGEAVRQDPRRIAQSYMDALVAGDAGAANALTSATVDDLPAADSLADAETIESFSLGEGRRTSFLPHDGVPFDGMAFDVEYVVAGERVEGRIAVEDLGGWWIEQRWAIRDALVQEVQIQPADPVVELTASFAGAETRIQAPRGGEAGTVVLLYPGVYDLVPRSGELVDVVPVEDVLVVERTRIEVEASPTEEAAELAIVVATQAAASCIERAWRDLLGCAAQLFLDAEAPPTADVAWSFDVDAVAEPGVAPWGYEVPVTMVAAYVDEGGATVERRFPLVARIALYEVTVDSADGAVVDWGAD